jgi:hypothetical protein
VHLSTCPDLALLYSAHEGVLPGDQGGEIREHIAQCEICTRLFEDLESIDFGTPTAIEVAHIRERIQREAPRAFERPQPSPSWIRKRWWVPALAMAACAVAAVFVLRPTEAPQPAAQLAEARPLPQVPLEKLAIHVDPMSLLATRGASSATQPSVAELAKGLQKYQHDDYAGAAEQLKALAEEYPQDGTVRLYLGISELFLKQNGEAAGDLAAATNANDGARLADSEWFLGIAQLRSQKRDSALALFHDLCKGKSGYSQHACEIESQLKK